MPTKTVTFAESTSSSRSQVVNIPNLKSITSVTVNTGTVTHSVSGNDVTVNVNNGTYTRYTSSSYTPSQSVSDYRTSSSDSFASTISYNSGGYSGTLSKNGSSYQNGGSYTPSESRTERAYESQVGCADWIWSSGAWQNIGSTSFPSHASSVSYNSGGFSGSLGFIGYTNAYGSAQPSGTGTNGQTRTTCTGQRTVNWSGTVTKPAVDTRTYRQDYSGTVYGATETYYTYYYAYTVTITYEEFQAPTAPTLIFPVGAETITSAKEIKWNAGTDVETPIVNLQYEIGVSTNGGTSYTNIANLTAAGVTTFLYDFLSLPDTSQGKIRIRTYDGSMYSPYAYSGNFSILHNVPPTVAVTVDGVLKPSDSNHLVTGSNNVVLGITPNDVDDTNLQYKIDFRGVNKVPFTAVTKGQTVNYTVLNNQIAVGVNMLVITIKDSVSETKYSLAIRNRTPQTLSLREVLAVEQSLGYPNTSYSNLKGLVPNGYSGKLSLSDILNYLT